MSCTNSVFNSYNCASEVCGHCLTFCKCISDCDTCAPTSTRCYCGQRYFLSLAVFFTLVMCISFISFVCNKLSTTCTVSTLIIFLHLVIASALCMFLEPYDVKYEVILGTTFLTLACTLGVCISYFCYPNFATDEDEPLFDFNKDVEAPKKQQQMETPPKRSAPRNSLMIGVITKRLTEQFRRPSPSSDVSKQGLPDTPGSVGISNSDSEETTDPSENDVYGNMPDHLLHDDHPALFGSLLSADSVHKSMNFGVVWSEHEFKGEESAGERMKAPTSNGSTCEIAPL